MTLGGAIRRLMEALERVRGRYRGQNVNPGKNGNVTQRRLHNKSKVELSADDIDEDDLGDEVSNLAARIAANERLPLGEVRRRLLQIAEALSKPALQKVARGDFDKSELNVATVKGRVRHLVNRQSPRFTHCTGGTSLIEISPSGDYTRCTKFSRISSFIGNVKSPGPIIVLDPATDDMSCSIRCPQVMCHTHNVVRGTSVEDFHSKLAEFGIKGNYRSNYKHTDPDVCIRWKITDVCNYTCTYCSDWKSVNKRGLELTDAEIMETAEKILDQFDNIYLRMTGGEPSARRCYVDMMRMFHRRIDKISSIDMRTNLSFQEKHKEILSWDWQGKLSYHVGCHVRDRNFMPWRFVDILKDNQNVDYVLKFVVNRGNRQHVEFFRDYFVKNGIPAKNILLIQEVSMNNGVDRADEEDSIPYARKAIEAGVKTSLEGVVAPVREKPLQKTAPIRIQRELELRE